MATKRSTQRIPREDGSELLIKAAIELLREMPAAKVTVRDVASRAGLQTMHLKRYFGSRNDLFVVVSNRLMTRIVDALADKPLDKVFPWLQRSQDVTLRLRLISHLLNEGVEPSRFADDHTVYMRIAERIAAVNNVGPRTAQTYAHVIQLVLQGNRLIGEVNGLSAKQRSDIFQLLAVLSTGLPNAEKLLSW